MKIQQPVAGPRFAAQVFAIALGSIWASTVAVRAEEIDFNRDIRPILADKCFACHGPDAGQRQGGPDDGDGLRLDTEGGAMADLGGRIAIVRGRPEQSELVRRIQSDDPDTRMPPTDFLRKLTRAEIRLLTEWVQSGAPWAGHWAWIPPRRYEVPERPAAFAGTNRGLHAGNWIDNFVLVQVAAAGLKPSDTADARTLFRRLSFDLLGLPPDANEIAEFVRDPSDAKYEQAVDRLLKSPHFGERMAVFWLDLVRYADSVGYHGDQPVSVSPYRDYVIDAFNENMPFDRFTREQLAGDLLPNATIEQQIASGYNRLGMMSAEGGVQPKEYLAKYAADRVRTASSVWLGATMGCAECHDHKFDPFTMSDFYRFASFFADIKEKGLYSGAHANGRWGPQIDVPDDDLPARLAPIDARITPLQKTLDTHTPALVAAQRDWEASLSSTPAWTALQPDDVKSTGRVVLKKLDDQSVLATGPSPAKAVYTLTARPGARRVTGFRIDVLPDDSLPQKGSGRAGNGNFVLTEFKVQFKPDAKSPAVAVDLQNSSATIEQTTAGGGHPDKKWSAASAIDGDSRGATWGWAILPDVGRPQSLVVECREPLAATETSVITLVLEQNHNNPRHTIGRFRVSTTDAPGPLKADQHQGVPDDVRKLLAIDAKKRNADQAAKIAAYYRTIAPSLADTRRRVANLQKQRESIRAQHTRTTLVTVAVEPREMRVLPRGNWMDDSGKVVQPGVPSFLRQLNPNGRATRLDLAGWITSPDNPLTARVFVNRLWKMYFGTGLSKVLDDVGAQGEWPTHPELLDTLAMEFMESGWNVKHIIKLMVMSQTYRQSSLVIDDLQQADPYNRLLARQARFRLDAEMIRDNALAVSGLLVRKIGGRPAKPYQPAGLYRHLNFPARVYKHDTGESQYRRGVYTHWQRQFLHPAMKTFDAPAREECTAERPRSNTPLAALVLLNDPSYVEAARVFAERVLQDAPSGESDRIDWILQHSLSRKATPEEHSILAGLLASQRKRFAGNPKQAAALIGTGLKPATDRVNQTELAAWTAVTRTVFNMHEFITRN